MRERQCAKIVKERLAEMDEIQAEIRETTERSRRGVCAAFSAPRRIVMVVGLALQRIRAGATAPSTCAPWPRRPITASRLPTTLAAAREMKKIQEWLGQGDASPRTIALEETRRGRDLR